MLARTVPSACRARPKKRPIIRTIQDATVKRFYYEAHDQLRSHLADFVTAYNFAKRLKTLTLYEYNCKLWAKEPDRFTLNPLQQMPGLNTSEKGATSCAQSRGTFNFRCGDSSQS